VTKLLYAAASAFLRAFAITFLMAATGIAAAPNVETAQALSIAALIASIAGGLRAIQVFIPQLSFGTFIRQPIAAWLDAFVRAFLATLVVSVQGLLAMPELPTDRSVWFAAITGALTAGLRALQGLLTPGEQPAPDTGISDPTIIGRPPPPG
jgi:hypothetical protein